MPSPPRNSRTNHRRAAMPVRPGDAVTDEELRQWMTERRQGVDAAALVGVRQSREKPLGVLSTQAAPGVVPKPFYCFKCDETLPYELVSPASEPYKLRATWLREPCACERDRRDRRQRQQEMELRQGRERQEKARLFRNRGLSGLMTGKPAKMTFGAWKERGEGVGGAKAAVERWADEFRPASHRGLTLYSPSRGVGKTHLICAAGHRILAAGYSVLVITAADLIDAARKEARREGSGDIVEYARSVDYLGLDDLGTEDSATDFYRATMYRVIDYRWKQEKPTLFTTNLTLSQLEPAIGGEMGSRIVSRMSGMATITPLIGLDYRQEEGL